MSQPSVPPPSNDNAECGQHYPEPFRDAEVKLLLRRRAAVQDNAAAPARACDAIGAGLSGGGIRSATFCLGVFQSLARFELLKRIDYLSTVSGGGYFGSFLGRLYAREVPPGAVPAVPAGQRPPTGTKSARPGFVEKVLTDKAQRDVLRALRSNGRYIAPSGGGDLMLLVAVLLRNWIAIMFVLLATMLAAFTWLEVVRAALALSPWIDKLERVLNPSDGLVAGHLYWSALLVVFPVPVALVAFGIGTAYWVPRSLAPVAFGLAALATALAVWSWSAQKHTWLVVLTVVACIFVISGAALMAARRQASALKQDNDPSSVLQVESKARSLLSRSFSMVLWVCVFSVCIGLIDSVGRTVYGLIMAGRFDAWWTWLVGGVTGMFGGGLASRTFALLFAKRPSESRPALSTSAIATIAATLVTLFLLTFSSAFVQALTWRFNAPSDTTGLITPEPSKKTWLSLPGADGTSLELHETRPVQTPRTAAQGDGFEHLIAAIEWGLGLTLLAGAVGWSRNFLLLSSHHSIYSARLTRAYLGASNPDRMGGRNDMTDVRAGDDIALSDYYPKAYDDPACGVAHGAPLHYINVTVNETVDGETKLQQQDRRGVGLALGPCGLSLGVRHHCKFWWKDVEGKGDSAKLPSGEQALKSAGSHQVFSAPGKTKPDMLSLGRWISISGAAFSTGIGSRTSFALSLLAGVFNIRLGHWWDPGLKGGAKLFDAFVVQSYLARELFARFPGTAKRLWYLSDGGHFENMGGYELIRRQLRRVVVIDAEADPDYTFGGLADLIRKARLDFSAEILFLNAEQLTQVIAPEVRNYFGTLDDLRRLDSGNSSQSDRTRTSRAYAALARISYSGSPNADDGMLLYIKPTLLGKESADLLQYHAEHADFPQESTADQFFDEAQWESYRKLGAHIGETLFAATPSDASKFVPQDIFDWTRASPWPSAQPAPAKNPAA